MSKNKETIEWYRKVKENSKCIVCGESHPAIIEFHHKDASTKKHSISRMVYNGMDICDIMDEMDKTIPLCKNHHAMIHWEQNKNPLGLDIDS